MYMSESEKAHYVQQLKMDAELVEEEKQAD